MEKDRSAKIIAIVALFVGVMGLTIGFSTFTQQLNIKSSADVTITEEDNYNMVLSTASNSVVDGDLEGVFTPTQEPGSAATAATATINGKEISGLKANFTAPGQTVTYTFYGYNDGEIDAWLKAVTFNAAQGATAGETKVCTSKGNADQDLVNTACNAISVSVKVGNLTVNSPGQSAITNHKVEAGDSEEIVVTIKYEDVTGARPDGDFEVAFGDIGLTYNSNDK